MAADSPTTWDELLAGPFNIHSVTTHNSLLLAAMRDRFNLTDGAFHQMMRADHLHLTRSLDALGIAYGSLAKGLIPDHRRREIVLLFDSKVASARSNGFYARDVADAWISGLPRPKNGLPVNSILRGDLLGPAPSDKVQAAMDKSVVYHRPYTVTHPELVYCVYITNLSKEQTSTLTSTAAEHPAYFGYADCTGRSTLKTHLGLSLPNSGLRVGDTILEGVYIDNEPNGTGLPFEAHGFTPTAVLDMLFLPFLGYRINSHLTGQNLQDNRSALTILSPDAAHLESPNIWMTPGRYGYLQDGKHRDSMEQAGLLHLDQPGLEAAVSRLVAQGHLYNLRLDAYGNLLYTALVDVEVVDGRFQTFTIGLRLNPEDKRVELMTFF
ncbi:hypothetical protein ACH4TS_19980 [Streptomyces albidoflavus]